MRKIIKEKAPPTQEESMYNNQEAKRPRIQREVGKGVSGKSSAIVKDDGNALLGLLGDYNSSGTESS